MVDSFRRRFGIPAALVWFLVLIIVVQKAADACASCSRSLLSRINSTASTRLTSISHIPLVPSHGKDTSRTCEAASTFLFERTDDLGPIWHHPSGAPPFAWKQSFTHSGSVVSATIHGGLGVVYPWTVISLKTSPRYCLKLIPQTRRHYREFVMTSPPLSPMNKGDFFLALEYLNQESNLHLHLSSSSKTSFHPFSGCSYDPSNEMTSTDRTYVCESSNIDAAGMTHSYGSDFQCGIGIVIKPDVGLSVILHEVLHVLGFAHEQNHRDAGKYLMQGSPEVGLWNSRHFDFSSIMLYEMQRQNPRPEFQQVAEQSKGGVPSSCDMNILNRIYMGPIPPTPCHPHKRPNVRIAWPKRDQFVVNSFATVRCAAVQYDLKECVSRSFSSKSGHFQFLPSSNEYIILLMHILKQSLADFRFLQENRWTLVVYAEIHRALRILSRLR